MADEQHTPTPGPWHIKHDFNVFSGERLVASAGGHANNVQPLKAHAENIANAHLIAAAPDLLAAVRTAKEAFDRLLVERKDCGEYGTECTLHNAGKSWHYVNEALAVVAAAIAKAEGRQP